MSTPDDRNNRAEGATPATGMNAWKGGLAGPKARPSAAAPQAPLPPPPERPRTKRWQFLSIGLAIAGVLAATGLVVRSFLRSQPPATASVARAPRPSMVTPVPANPTAASHAPVYRALTIGINSYNADNGAGWQTLQSARPDAESIGRSLSENYGFQVRTLLDAQATRGAIMSALDELATDSGENDAVLVYFAGHGFYDEKLKEGYWIPADARRTANGRDAKEDWLWNSTLTRLFGAANARHVLVLADACYSGALFRGDQPLSVSGNRNWYERAFARRSRYLISSGGMEPVLDSGSGHSVFAQQVLNYLGTGNLDIFSANDLGLALRERVATLTGQMVQMGPLPVSEHAGGEFVFVRNKASAQFAALPFENTVAAADGLLRAAEASSHAATNAARQQVMRDALTLLQAGAPKSAGHLTSIMVQQNAQDQMAQAVAAYIKRSGKQEARDELQALIKKIEECNRARAGDAPKTPAARPRVLACLGPTLPAGLQASENSALLYRVMLSAELGNRGVARIVEREALASVLQEQQISTSDLADPRARMAIRKLLPASLLLLGDLLPTAQGDKLALRLVDSETSDVRATFLADCPAGGDIAAVCADLSGRITERLATLKPLLAPVTQANGAMLRADCGTFQGGRTGLVFTVVARTLRDRANPDDFAEQEVGTATVRAVSDFSSDLEAAWAGGTPPVRTDNLWIQERPATKP
ncbi:MAG: caspase family protein [Kiritimatiellia bacterium]